MHESILVLFSRTAKAISTIQQSIFLNICKKERNSYIVPFKLVHVSLRFFQLPFPSVAKLTVQADKHVGIRASTGNISGEHVHAISVF